MDEDIKRTRQEHPFEGYTESHPCFGTARLSRAQGSANLFGSVMHGAQHFVSLTISRAERHHEYSSDSYYDRDELIEVWMTNDQFAELITTWNMGNGVPVTLRRVRDGKLKSVPEIGGDDESESKRAEDLFNDKLSDVVAEFRNNYDALKEILNKKGAINKVERAKIEKIFWSVERWFDDSAPFACSTFVKSTERIVSKAKREVDAFVSGVIHKTGLDALKSLKLGMYVNQISEHSSVKDGDES